MSLTGGRHLILLVGALVSLHLCAPPWYTYPPEAPFAGPRWHNPYADLPGEWLRSNTHAHSSLWKVFAIGNGSPEVLRQRYREAGHDVYPLSNYQSIEPPDPNEEIPLSLYEHGFGLQKIHQTVFGAPAPTWFDLPLFQLTDGKQWLLDILRPEAKLLFINHPNIRGGYTERDMQRLSGYDAIEVHTSQAEGVAHWDAALSAGRRVWGICADDGHQPKSKGQVARGWIEVAASARTPEAFYEALRAGRFYGAYSRRYEKPNALKGLSFAEGTLSVALAEPAERIQFVGQGGAVLKEVEGSAEASYRPTPDDTYVRVQADTRLTHLILNPVYRYTEDPAERFTLRAQARPVLTWLRRGAGLLALGFLAWLLHRRRRAPTPPPSAPPESVGLGYSPPEEDPPAEDRGVGTQRKST